MREIRLSAPCYPTEDRDRITRSMKSIFPDAEFNDEGSITAVASSFEVFAELLKRQRIRDAARRVMRRHMHGRATSFRLNKQVAVIGKVSFSEEEHPLGDIEVTITADDLESLIDEIAPRTGLKVSR